MKLSDIVLDDFQEDVIGSNIINWVHHSVVSKISDKFIEAAGENILNNIKIDKQALEGLVMNKLADKIIDTFMGARNDNI